MKCVLVLVTVHLCYAMGMNVELNIEMQDNLRALKNVTHGTFNSNVVAPESKMRNNASCLGVFKRELTKALDEVKASDEGRVYIRKLRANLRALENSHNVTNSLCLFKHQKLVWTTFNKYITFLKKLNNRG